MTNQYELAEIVADEMCEVGHEVGVLDVLEVLASCGLALTPMGDSNPASEAYILALGVLEP